jgi:hypothetical protein
MAARFSLNVELPLAFVRAQMLEKRHRVSYLSKALEDSKSEEEVEQRKDESPSCLAPLAHCVSPQIHSVVSLRWRSGYDCICDHDILLSDDTLPRGPDRRAGRDRPRYW